MIRVVDQRRWMSPMGDGPHDMGIDVFPFEFDHQRANHEYKVTVNRAGQHNAYLSPNGLPTELNPDEAQALINAYSVALTIAQTGQIPKQYQA